MYSGPFHLVRDILGSCPQGVGLDPVLSHIPLGHPLPPGHPLPHVGNKAKEDRG